MKSVASIPSYSFDSNSYLSNEQNPICLGFFFGLYYTAIWGLQHTIIKIIIKQLIWKVSSFFLVAHLYTPNRQPFHLCLCFLVTFSQGQLLS